MPKWTNWSGKLSEPKVELKHIYSETSAAALALAATAAGQRVRAVGSGHSHQPLIPGTEMIVDLQGLAGIIPCDTAAQTAWVYGGSRIFSLGRGLHEAGLALPNQGDIDQQTISGAIATGTHGTGATLGSLSTRVVGCQLATAAGELVECSPEVEPELWQASRLHLGALGLVTRVKLALVEAYRLTEHGWQCPLAQLFDEFENLIEQHRHFEFFWYPQTDTAHAKYIDQTDAAAQYPVGEEGTRTAWSYEVLPNHRPARHTEMEYSVPRDQGMACMRDIQELLNKEFTDVRWPVEYRTLAADDVWLSTAFERPTVTISVHQGMDADDTAYFHACEEIFLAYGGKPHWGKVNYLDGEQMAALHPRWQDWWRVRDAIDPQGTFLNAYLESLRG